MFPWADANLRTYWYEHKPTPEFEASTILWSLQQMLGIAQALSLIHNFRPTLPLGAPSTKDLNLPKDMRLDVKLDEQQFGRHGDIKPENILWLKKDGTLKVADFGLGRFHSRDSRSKVDPQTVPASPTYVPPELALGVKVSRAYDIWSLGCMFLEFITWILAGAETIEEFSDFRGLFFASTEINDDYFYTILEDTNGYKKAVVRDTVNQWVEKLHENEKCSQLIHELLDLTMSRLLVIQSKNRTSSQQLSVDLSEMLKKAEKDKGYMLDPVALDAKQGPALKEPTRNVSGEPQAQPDNTHPAQHLIESVLPHVINIRNTTRDLLGRTIGTPGYRPPRNTWSVPTVATRATTT